MEATDIAWLAGVFEGEGSIYIARNGGIRLTIRMTDLDVIERVNALFPCTKIQVVQPGSHKTQYAWRLSDPAKATEFLELVLPWLGQRRIATAKQLFEHLATRPGTGGYQRAKTHCAQGHEYTPENTVTRKGTSHRRCRTCMRQWDAISRDRKRALKRTAADAVTPAAIVA